MIDFAVDHDALATALARGLRPFAVPPPMTLDQWARQHFYLSSESSYVEQTWQPWPYQRAIMACISNDDIREIDWMKAARVGNTKIMLAAIGYFAEHKRRNQAIWQPCDDDRDDFVKTELDPMLRDVAVMQSVFPSYLQRHKDNTMQQKSFIGSKLHLRGGKAAKNYRRISIDCAYIDEADAFDQDIEREGDAVMLAAKRIEGATFPKLVVGSTPKLKGFSLIEARARLADLRVAFVVPCSHCGDFHPITWGGKDEPHGFKWTDHDPETVRHLCRTCGGLMSQGDFLGVWEKGFYRSDDGHVRLDGDGRFSFLADGRPAPVPRHLSIENVWTAYSPLAGWPDIVRDFLAAHDKAGDGDLSKLKTFVNTTLGLPWEQEVERSDVDELINRAEPLRLGTVPMGALLLLAGIDTQDNRLELTLWGYGRGCEMYTIDHQIFWGNPAEADVWAELDDYLFRDFPHASGESVRIHAAAIDSRGHNTHAVYNYCARHARKRIYPVAGRPGREKAINDGHSKVDIDYRGRQRRQGVMLWHVGTNLAKDLLYSRLALTRPGPGYVHLADALSDEWFAQLAGEARAERVGPRGRESRWTATRKRVEAWDCAVYTVWLEHKLDLPRRSDKWWDALEEKVQPPTADLFGGEPVAPPPEPVSKADKAPRRARLPQRVGLR